MLGFRERKIVIPEGIWNRDWVAAFVNRREEERRILECQKRITELLRDIPSQGATPERTAWMIFWTRAFLAAQSTFSCLQDSTEQMLIVIQRMCLEMDLQMLAIVEPLKASESEGIDSCWQTVLDRFRAYVTWCLWADQSLIDEMLSSNSVARVCDTTQAQSILSDERQRQFWEEFFWGGREVYEGARNTNPAEFRRRLTTELRQIERLLGDQSLSIWRSKLVAKPQSPFCALFGEDEGTVRKRLKRMDANFVYSLYRKGSMAIHGNSLDQFLYETSESSWMPRMVTATELTRTTATMAIAGHLEAVYVLLNLTKTRIWKLNQP